MVATPLAWILTTLAIVGLLAVDLIFHVRRPHAPTIRESATWSALYVGIALSFGVGMLAIAGREPGAQYFAGYITEKALSVDNLFVFLILMSSFRVPREDQQKVLLVGIAIALLARSGLILLGSALINSFAWVFYIFGVVLLLTAGNMLRPSDEGPGEPSVDNVVVRAARRVFRTTDEFDGDRLFTLRQGRRHLTPMLLVMIAIGGTDVLFALDSVPAIFGLTDDVYIVFTATAFSMLGLRQLYFLIDGLLDRLIYLSWGLAGILAFIGIKLVLHALHHNNLPFVNGGSAIDVVEIPTLTSLVTIGGILLVTIATSLLSRRGRVRSAIAGAQRHAAAYLDPGYTTDPVERERVYARLLEDETALRERQPAFRRLIRSEADFMDLIARAHFMHDGVHWEPPPLTD